MRLILLLFLLLLFGCKREVVMTHFEGSAHTHRYHVQIGQPLRNDQKDTIITIIDSVFETINTHYNHWNPLSELSRINQLAVGESIVLSSQLLHLIQKAQNLTLLTEGHFDPTYGTLISLWKEGLKMRTIPSQPYIEPTGWNAFSFNEDKAIRLIKGVTIDLDGLLKGWAVDQIVEKLRQKNFTNFYVEWGGEIRVCGHHPSGRKWLVALPILKENITLSDKALATSGNTYQSCKIDGKLYSHIVIPETKTTIPTIEAVSVEAPTCFFADALATAFMTYPSTEAILIYLNSHKEICKECKVWVTNLQGETKKWEHTIH